MANKPFAQAAQQNRDDILPVLEKAFQQATNVLEIGSGTGQHAVYFAQHLTHLNWQASDVREMLPGINLWINEATLSNLPKAIELDVNEDWPNKKYDAAYAANVAHIMHWPDIEAMFAGLSSTLENNALFCLYGPFNIEGKYTSESNQRFDQWLKETDPEAGLRDTSQLNILAEKHGMQSAKYWQLPSNNMLLSWIN